MAIFQGADKQNQEKSSQPSRTKSVLRYTMMPEILPRIRALGLHFGHFAYLLALVFSSARLIPQSHPVLNAANIGRYGVRQVIAMAANNITWSKNNIDQIAIFSAIVIGLIMIVIQGILIAIAALVGMNPAGAQTVNATSFFETPNETDDVVYDLLRNTFGSSLEIFGPAGAPNTSTESIYLAVYEMLSLYSMAMMVIAVIIVLYYIMTVVGEAAKTGTPFGSRFNSLWAPIRLVVALGLLVPLGSGLNSAQYITLWMAKMGSGLGSQVWNLISDDLTSINPERLIINPDSFPSSAEYVRHVILAEVCAQSFNMSNPGGEQYDLERIEQSNGETISYIWQRSIVTTSQRGQGSRPTVTRRNTEVCGSVTFDFSDITLPAIGISGGSVEISTEDLRLESEIIFNSVRASAQGIAQAFPDYYISIGRNGFPIAPNEDALIQRYQELVEQTDQSLEQAVEALYNQSLQAELGQIAYNVENFGWGYAGIWYMNIGKILQDLRQPINMVLPTIDLPIDENSIIRDITTAEHINNTFRRAFGNQRGDILQEVYTSIMSANDIFRGASPRPRGVGSSVRRLNNGGGNAVADRPWCPEGVEDMNDSGRLVQIECLIIETLDPEKLFELQNDRTLDPMTKLIDAGADIVSKAYRMFVYGVGFGVLGGIVSGIPIIGPILGSMGEAAASIAFFVGFIGLAAGIVLYFVLPLFPFIYFFFAVITWVLEIIEAVIAMPLWALAHLKIDGDGMPGPSAISGYFLLFAILIRPPLIIFGLVMGYIAFGAGTTFLQMLFSPLLEVVRDDKIWGLEAMIFVIAFTYIVYSLGLICFKMVDSVPGNILRWIGSSAQTFADQKPVDPVQGTQGAVIAAAALGGQAQGVMGGVGGVGKGVSGGVGQARQMGRQNKIDAGQEKQQEFSNNQMERQTTAQERLAGIGDNVQPNPNQPQPLGGGGAGQGGGGAQPNPNPGRPGGAPRGRGDNNDGGGRNA